MSVKFIEGKLMIDGIPYLKTTFSATRHKIPLVN